MFRIQSRSPGTTASAATPAAPATAPSLPLPKAKTVEQTHETTATALPILPTLLVAPPPVVVQALEESADEEMKEAEATVPPGLSSYDALQLLRDCCFDATARGAITTLMKIVTNVLSNPGSSACGALYLDLWWWFGSRRRTHYQAHCWLLPENDKMRSIRVSNAAFQRSIGQLRGGVEFLQSVGFALDQDTLCLVLQSAVDATAELENGLRLLHKEADDLNIDQAARPQVIVPRAPDPTFDVYKSQITRMQARRTLSC